MFEEDLVKAERPAILVGGGAYNARQAIVDFAELHRIPVFRTWNAMDVITDDSRAFCGTVGTYGGKGRNFGIQNCDLLLVLGCRLSGRITGGMPDTFARGAKIYLVEVDMGLLDPENQQRKADVNIRMDCGEFMQNINSRYIFDNYRKLLTEESVSWFFQCWKWSRDYDPVKPEHHEQPHHYGIMRKLSNMLPANAIVTYDTGGNAIMMGHCFESKKGQRIFSSNGNSPMGFSMCGAIGAWFAEPERPVFCIIGDGGMQLNIQELQTIVHYGCNVKVIIMNNQCLGNTRAWQVQNDKAQIACGPDGYSSPDFVAVAHAYGLLAYEYNGLPLLESWIEQPRPCVINILHPDFFDYRPRMTLWDAGIEECYPVLPEQEFLGNMLIPPLEGWRERRTKYKEMEC